MAASVLVIDSEEWVSAMLIDALRDEGLDASGMGSAEAGRDGVLRLAPGCVVCALDLPAPGGIWLLQSIRKQSGPVSVTPFLLLVTEAVDEDELERVRSSADRVMSKPFDVDEVIACVKSLLDEAPRLRSGHRHTRPPVAGPAAITAGALKDTSASTLLAVLEMERRDGCLEVMGDGTYVTLVLSGGYVISGAVDGEPATPLGAVKRLLACKTGNFSLKGIPPQPPSIHDITIRELIRLATSSSSDGIAAQSVHGRPPSQVVPPPAAPPGPRHPAMPPAAPRRPAPLAPVPKPLAPPRKLAAPKAPPPPEPPPPEPPPPVHSPTPVMPKAAPLAVEAFHDGYEANSSPGPLDSRLSSETVDELLAGLGESLAPTAVAPSGAPMFTEPAAEDAIEEEVHEVEADLTSYRPPSPEE